MRRDACERMMELVRDVGSAILHQSRELLRTGQPRQASACVGLMSCFDECTLIEQRHARLLAWNRCYKDMVVRQNACGAAPDSGRSLLELAEFLDPMILPEAVDVIFFFNDTATTEIYTLSLHDALPI